jgi:hypothetical protein
MFPPNFDVVESPAAHANGHWHFFLAGSAGKIFHAKRPV